MRFPITLGLILCSMVVGWAQSATEVEAVVTTDLGTFRFEFAPDKAPKHVESFIARARQGYYNGSAFHRAVANAIIQGGDPLLKNPATPKVQWGSGGLNLLAPEFSDMKHERGVISTVAIPGRANSEGAQFFACVAPQPQLDGKFTAFGRITEGLEVVRKISQAPVDTNGLIEKPVRIQKLTIEKKREDPYVNATADQMRKTVTLKTTLGTIKIKLEPDWAPNHVRAFLMLAQTGWYNGTVFHRIAKDFVVQGGMPTGRSTGLTHYADRFVHPLQAEFRKDVKHEKGVISMAHGEDPNSATTSFFLMLGPSPALDGQFSAFGRMIEGLDVLDAFAKEEVDGETPKRRLEIVEASVE